MYCSDIAFFFSFTAKLYGLSAVLSTPRGEPDKWSSGSGSGHAVTQHIFARARPTRCSFGHWFCVGQASTRYWGRRRFGKQANAQFAAAGLGSAGQTTPAVQRAAARHSAGRRRRGREHSPWISCVICWNLAPSLAGVPGRLVLGLRYAGVATVLNCRARRAPGQLNPRGLQQPTPTQHLVT